MTKAEAEAEAIKRERHKGKHLSHRRWEATHTPERGWHVALVECPYHAAEVARQKAFGHWVARAAAIALGLKVG